MIIKQNFKIRNQIKTQNNYPCDLRDPLNCDQYRFGWNMYIIYIDGFMFKGYLSHSSNWVNFELVLA